MPLMLVDRSIRRVRIIDDDPRARTAYQYPIEELDLEPVLAEGPLPSLGDFVYETLVLTQAAVCDYRLGVRNYANFNGAETVSLMYQKRFPAVLCTKWETASIDEMRPYRRQIAVLLRPNELNPDSFVKGIEDCINEFRGEFRAVRKPWRTLVRVEELDTERSFCYLVIPAWNTNEVVRVPLDSLPPGIVERMPAQIRFHAQVNIGAEENQELYFEEWEVD